MIHSPGIISEKLFKEPSDGVPVTIIHAENRDILVVDLENSTLTVNVIDFEEGPSGRTEADMEAFAECFDFSAVKQTLKGNRNYYQINADSPDQNGPGCLVKDFEKFSG